MAKKDKLATDEKTDIREIGDLDEASYPCLRVVAGPGRGAYYPLQPGKNLIGRTDMAHVMLDDSSISREHAELDVREEGALVHDRGSRNGTQVQGVRIEQDTPITHGQRLKVGIYDFQYLTGPAELPAEDSEPEGAPPPSDAPEDAVETVVEPETPVETAPPETPPEIPEELPLEVPADAQPPVLVEPEGGVPPEGEAETVPPVAAPSTLQRILMPLNKVKALFLRVPRRWRFIGAGLVVLALASWALLSVFQPGAGPSGPPEVPLTPVTPSEPKAVPGGVTVPVPEYVPVFLDFSSEPISAAVYFADEKVGDTPFRMSAHLQYGKTYEVTGKFRLEEINEVVSEVKRFSLESDQQVIPLKFVGKIGHMKIKSLPRGIEVYLEARFDTDPHQAKPIKFNEIIYGKPIYLPFGNYTLELRQSRQLSESQTFINQVVYRRKFQINAETPVFDLTVQKKELGVFPAKITSTPSEAELLVDGQVVGKTPFEGDLKVGEHELIIRRQGYFEHKQDIRVEQNTPFELAVELKTSEAGSLINEGRVLIQKRRYERAITILINALKSNPTTQEVAEAHYLIGQAYLYLKNYQEARDYFGQAMRHELYRFPARLGIAQIYFNQGERIKALQILTEVLLKAKRQEVRSEAGKLFQQISPFKSVLYVITEPSGATVTVNDKSVAVKSPLLLHDLMVGVYRLQFHLPGYQSHQVKVDLGVSEFKPLVVELEPVKAVP